MEYKCYSAKFMYAFYMHQAAPSATCWSPLRGAGTGSSETDGGGSMAEDLAGGVVTAWRWEGCTHPLLPLLLLHRWWRMSSRRSSLTSAPLAPVLAG